MLRASIIIGTLVACGASATPIRCYAPTSASIANIPSLIPLSNSTTSTLPTTVSDSHGTYVLSGPVASGRCFAACVNCAPGSPVGPLCTIGGGDYISYGNVTPDISGLPNYTYARHGCDNDGCNMPQNAYACNGIGTAGFAFECNGCSAAAGAATAVFGTMLLVCILAPVLGCVCIGGGICLIVWSCGRSSSTPQYIPVPRPEFDARRHTKPAVIDEESSESQEETVNKPSSQNDERHRFITLVADRRRLML